ncbi:zeatin O-glucosyltransferase-like [Cynara cardunculus var. scolymus]|uniref:zeatin O-glucosyltransferase-like n=1 Tax=Cynara cardunculus var. scolymus TaxID=59895 RepID=UPI000D62C4D4|nr:zeatin O-glucosyltransferase-like [Cynara cardunculus var. scolymus]XP_024968751.1 zeatin O-glucosyltransferase-like [Cynara cardunculus var. scolymus]
MDKNEVCVVMVPFIAQGHLNQLLHLSRLISAYDLPVHFVCATTYSRQAKLRIHGWDPLSDSNIHFHEFLVPSFPNPPPNPNAAIRFPAHLMPSFKAVMHLRDPFAKLLSDLSITTKRIVIIHDYLMSSVVQDFVTVPTAEVYMFQSCSAFCAFWYHWEVTQTLSLDAETESIWKKVPSLEGCFTDEFLELMDSEDSSFKKISSGTLYDTSKVLEEKFLELLKIEEISGTSKNWAIGPFNPVGFTERKDSGTESNRLLINWLDKQKANSVIYVSFGTTVSFTDEEAKEIAIGLEESGQKFIWVVRDADKGNIFAGEDRRIELPEGYEERIERRGVGVVVRGWAPQIEILGHPSTGGFMSHCGWNSSMEAISMGIPIAAWPMHADQPRNATLITELLGTGIYAREWARRDEKVAASMVAEAVRRLMVSEEGCGIRKKAAELGGVVRRSVEDGGVMRKELDAFVAEITRP